MEIEIGRMIVSMLMVLPMLTIISEADLYNMGDSSRVKLLNDSEYALHGFFRVFHRNLIVGLRTTPCSSGTVGCRADAVVIAII